MKKRFLPFGLLSLIIFSLAGILIFSTGSADKEISPVKKDAQSIAGAKAYLASLRNNQHTGVLDPKDVIAAHAEFDQTMLKSSASKEFTWEELGPDNMGGRTRALLFDNRDESGKTIYAGSVTGGIFKSTNGGSTWAKVNNTSGTACLNVTSMVQDASGNIYVGTGEGLGSQNYSAYGQLGYEGGFVGKGIFKSNNNDNFNLVQGTQPTVQGEVTEWAYINDLAIDQANNRMYAATHTGLKKAGLPDLNNWNSDIRYKLDSAIIYRGISIDSIVSCDSFEIVDGDYVLYGATDWETNVTAADTSSVESVFNDYVAFAEQGNCYDVKVSGNGVLYTVLNNRVYVSANGDATKLENKSIYPENPDYVRQDNITWTSTVVITDKQGNILHEGGSVSNQVYDWHTDYKEEVDPALMGYPSSNGPGRTEFAVSPSNPSVVYAQVAKGVNPNINSLLGIYMSEDDGQTWRQVAPGGTPSLNILGSTFGTNTPYYQGDYNNTITVFPNNPYRVLAGGINLWVGQKVNETGYFSWEAKSSSNALQTGGIYGQTYCHMDHHTYQFRPTNANQVFIGTDGGIYLGTISGSTVTFQSINKNYNVAQFYSLDISTGKNEFVGGAQDIGTVYVSGAANSGKNGEDIYRPANFSSAFPQGTDGGSVGFTTIGYTDVAGERVASPVFYSRGPRPENDNLIDRMRRSETLGFDFSLDFLSSDVGDNRFVTPMLLWESYDNQNSQATITWHADKDYAAGDPIVVRSNVYMVPFDYVLEEAIAEGDSIEIKDIVSNKLFIGVEDEVFMSLNTTDFSATPEWFMISQDNSNGVEGKVQSMAYSHDANYLWVGTDDGRLFRISNIANAFDENTADVSSSNCIIATTEVVLPGDISQVVTSIAVDPLDANKVVATLGNYGNENYVFYSSNGMADAPTFSSKQGNLPKMPVYASIIVMDENNNQVLVGSEMGVWATDNINNGEWYFASPEIGRLPVMAIKQRTYYKSKFTLTYYDPATGAPSYETYPEMKNYKDIFVATHGRGVFRYNANAVGIDEAATPGSGQGIFGMALYPNPATTAININLDLQTKTDVEIRVFDFAGRMLFSESLGLLPTGEQSHRVNISSLNEGTYLMQCISGNSITSKKFIVVK